MMDKSDNMSLGIEPSTSIVFALMTKYDACIGLTTTSLNSVNAFFKIGIGQGATTIRFEQSFVIVL